MNKERYKQGIIEAYKILRLENSSIPSDIVDFIKDASLEKLENLKTSPNNNFKAHSDSPKFSNAEMIKCPECKRKYPPTQLKCVDCGIGI